MDGIVLEFMMENIMMDFSCVKIILSLPFGIMVMLVASNHVYTVSKPLHD